MTYREIAAIASDNRDFDDILNVEGTRLESFEGRQFGTIVRVLFWKQSHSNRGG